MKYFKFRIPFLNQLIFVILLSLLLISEPISKEISNVNISTEELKLATETFRLYCAKCHGKEGKGDGRMNRIYLKLQVTTPTDFTIGFFEIRPPAYLRKIIKEGGEKNSRSKYMPPFADEISDEKIEALIKLINVSGELRKMPVAK